MSDLVKSKRAPCGSSSTTEDHEATEDTTIPDVTATPKTTGQTTPKPAPQGSSSSKITMADIKSMMRDITSDLTAKHKEEMKAQQDAVAQLQKQYAKLEHAKTKDINKPFETPRAERPQDLAYKQILTTSKKANVKATTGTASATIGTCLLYTSDAADE